MLFLKAALLTLKQCFRNGKFDIGMYFLLCRKRRREEDGHEEYMSMLRKQHERDSSDEKSNKP